MIGHYSTPGLVEVAKIHAEMSVREPMGSRETNENGLEECK